MDDKQKEILRNLALLGIVGVGIGASAYAVHRSQSKKKAFISFDFDNDKTLKDFIVGQSKMEDSPFEIVDVSLKEAAPERNWEQKAQEKIISADLVIVMVGSTTYRASGVLKEVQMANRFRKKMFQIIGYKDTNPIPVPNAGPLYKWNWDTLKRLLA